MREHSERWTRLILETEDMAYRCMMNGWAIKEAFKEVKQSLQVTVEFWISFTEVFSVEDIEAIRDDGSKCCYPGLWPRKDCIDILSVPLVSQIPFLRECRLQLTSNPYLLPSHSSEDLMTLFMLLKKIDRVVDS